MLLYGYNLMSCFAGVLKAKTLQASDCITVVVMDEIAV
jgi:hypothetical protein